MIKSELVGTKWSIDKSGDLMFINYLQLLTITPMPSEPDLEALQFNSEPDHVYKVKMSIRPHISTQENNLETLRDIRNFELN